MKTNKIIDISEQLIENAQDAGADAVDVLFMTSTSKDVVVKNQATRDIVSDTTSGISLRVIKDNREAFVLVSNFDDDTLAKAVEKSLAMARVLPEDENVGIAPESYIHHATEEEIASLDCVDNGEIDEYTLKELCLEMEQEATSFNGISDVDNVRAGMTQAKGVHMTSEGLSTSGERTMFSIETEAIAGEGDNKENYHDGVTKTHLGDLPNAKDFAQTVANTAVLMLNPTTIKSGKMPILLSRNVSARLLGSLSSAIDGYNITSGNSYLKDHLGKKIMGDGVNIIDDPRMARQLMSSIIDGDGAETSKTNLIEDGVLTQWMLNLYTAKKLNLTPNGFGVRSLGGYGLGTSNLYMENGKDSIKDMIADIKFGVFVNELMGQGINQTTGDLSFGATGWLIENGEVTNAVSGITIASNVLDVFATMKPCDDLIFKRGTNAPSLLIPEMTVGGE